MSALEIWSYYVVGEVTSSNNIREGRVEIEDSKGVY